MTEARSEGLSRPERLAFMRRRLRLLGLPRLGFTLGLLALLASEANASLFGGFSPTGSEFAGGLEDAIDAGWTDRHDVTVEHYVCQPSISFRGTGPGGVGQDKREGHAPVGLHLLPEI
jgi:hypothetical protein